MQPFNYYQPMQQPYMDRMAYLQQYQQSLQPTQMPNQQFQAIGKVVEGIESVKTVEIPMDGNTYYFPKADGTEVYGKRWGMDGRTYTTVFKPILGDKDEKANDTTLNAEKAGFALSDESTAAFMKRFDSIDERLDRVEKSIKPVSRKKEVSADE